MENDCVDREARPVLVALLLLLRAHPAKSHVGPSRQPLLSVLLETHLILRIPSTDRLASSPASLSASSSCSLSSIARSVN